LKSVAGKLLLAGAVLGIFLFLAEGPLVRMMAALPAMRAEAALAALAIGGCLIYGGLVVALLGRSWLRGLAERSSPHLPAPPTA
jgi:hypothetical protein